MVKAIDEISGNKQLQDRRRRRISAVIVDGIIMIVIWVTLTVIIAFYKIKRHQ